MGSIYFNSGDVVWPGEVADSFLVRVTSSSLSDSTCDCRLTPLSCLGGGPLSMEDLPAASDILSEGDESTYEELLRHMSKFTTGLN